MRGGGEKVEGSHGVFRAGLPHTPKITVKYGDMSLIRETGEYVPRPSLATYTASLSRRIVPSPPRGRLSAHPAPAPGMGPELRGVQVEAGPSGAHRVLFGGEEPDVGTSTVRGQDARHGGPTDPERERDPEGSVPSTRDVGGREEGGPSPHVDGVAESSSEAKAKAVGEEKEEEEGAEPAAAVSGTSPHRERFDGFAKTNRKWFDESGYSGCLERLEELEGIVEAQFRDLHAKGYGVPKPASIGKDGPLKLKLEELEELERAVERQHRTLVDSGILPTDSLPIFAAK